MEGCISILNLLSPLVGLASMAQNLLLISFTSIFFVFIFLSQHFHSIEGRYLNSATKSNHVDNQFYQKETTNTRKHDSDIITNATTATNVSSPAPPTHQVVGGAGASPPPPSPSHGIDDFRSTAPGHSPGVGHSIQN
ncbi:Precursor of CEP3 [Quillaja saponaria]|uniref:Precursor of CEP3 n=1 Tax=Quillaja saponaria TaxID=32244 RepID=A0AAD7KT11_QUISA|nr:Precursor of CEP3 [Quillaja saponaria]